MSLTKVDNKLLVWGVEGIEENTLDQARLTARLPFVHSHVALMPDAHVGIGATVGSVIATQGAIVPARGGSRYRLRDDRDAYQPRRGGPP